MPVKKEKAKKTPTKVETSYDKTHELKKLKVYIAIVNRGQGQTISFLMQKYSSAAQFISVGNGTAVKEITDILGIEDNGKDVVFALIREDKISDMILDLEEYFAMNKGKNRGIGFSIRMTSMIGVKLYKFLTDTSEE